MGLTHQRRPWQLPYKRHVITALTLAFRVIRRCYVTTCRHYVISSPLSARTWRVSLQKLFLFIATGYLLVLLSSETSKHMSGLDAEIMQHVQALGSRDLCWEELRGPLGFVRRLDIEIGLIKNGTLLFRFSPTEQEFPDEKDVTFRTVTCQRRAEERRRRRKQELVHDTSADRTGSVFLSRKMNSLGAVDSGARQSDLSSNDVQLQNPRETRRNISKRNSEIRTPSPRHSNFNFTDQKSVTDNDFLIRPSRTRVLHDLLVTSRSWEPVTGGDDNLFVYSAFYDDRRGKQTENENRRVRVLSIGVFHELVKYPQLRKQVFCHFRWENTTELHVSQRGTIQSIWEDHNLTYHAMFILCDLHLCASPEYVGVTVERGALPRSYLRIKYPPSNRTNHVHNISTCFPVMHSHYDNTADFLQVMEASQILGSEKFTLYVHDASHDVMTLIKHYVTSGILNAIEWQIPLKNVSLVHYYGQMAAVNDCLYESMYYSRHVVFQDFDEILLPRLHDTWHNMLEEFQYQGESLWERWRRFYGGSKYGCFTFLHVFFPKNWTHPGLPGDYVMEGSDSEVDPNNVEEFVYGFKEEKPKKDDKKEASEDGKDETDKSEEKKDENEKEKSESEQQGDTDLSPEEKSEIEECMKAEDTEQNHHNQEDTNQDLLHHQEDTEQNQLSQQRVTEQNQQTPQEIAEQAHREQEEKTEGKIQPSGVEERERLGAEEGRVVLEVEQKGQRQGNTMRNSRPGSTGKNGQFLKDSAKAIVMMKQAASHRHGSLELLPPDQRFQSTADSPSGTLHTNLTFRSRQARKSKANRVHSFKRKGGRETKIKHEDGKNSHHRFEQSTNSEVPDILIYKTVAERSHQRLTPRGKYSTEVRTKSFQPSGDSNRSLKVESNRTRAGRSIPHIKTALSSASESHNLPQANPKSNQIKDSSNEAAINQVLDDLSALRLTWRENIVWATTWRSKTLILPEAVLMMGIHSVHMFLPGYNNRDLTSDQALVHHYRNWWVKNGTVMVHDTSAMRLEQLLKTNIERVLEEMNRQPSTD